MQATQETSTTVEQGKHDAQVAGSWICFSCDLRSPEKSMLSEHDVSDMESFVCMCCDTRRYGVRYASLRTLDSASPPVSCGQAPPPARMQIYTFTKADLRDNAFKIQGTTAPFSVDAGDIVPDEFRPFIGTDFSGVRTNGNGACAPHPDPVYLQA